MSLIRQVGHASRTFQCGAAGPPHADRDTVPGAHLYMHTFAALVVSRTSLSHRRVVASTQARKLLIAPGRLLCVDIWTTQSRYLARSCILCVCEPSSSHPVILFCSRLHIWQGSSVPFGLVGAADVTPIALCHRSDLYTLHHVHHFGEGTPVRVPFGGFLVKFLFVSSRSLLRLSVQLVAVVWCCWPSLWG